MLALAITAGVAASAAAQVNWLDPLQYQKPAFVPVTLPDEASTPNKYYVDFQSGSGTACTQASPCNSVDAVLGKPGTTGGPAYIYLRGTGSLFLYLSKSLYGSAGNEVVIKPWGSSLVTLNGQNAFEPDSAHRLSYIVIDGGPNLGISMTAPNSEFVPALSFNNAYDNDQMSHITVYRTRISSGTAAGNLLTIQGVTSYLSFINNEFYNSNPNDGRQHQIYPSANGGGNSRMVHLYFRNNIIRDIGGDGIEFNLRNSNAALEIDDAIVEGNAFHNIGKQTCSVSWGCRPAITLANQQDGINWGAVTIRNNLIWDTGEGAVRTWAGNPLIVDNTVFDWGKGGTGYSWAFYGYSGDGSGTIRNNLMYSPAGKNPFDGSPFVASNNLCASGKSCGSASQTWSANTVLSIDPNNAGFMQLAANSEARNNGLAISTITSDYAGKSRPPYDIGAFIYGSSTATGLTPPSNLRVVTP
jgi:hypothetical protein